MNKVLNLLLGKLQELVSLRHELKLQTVDNKVQGTGGGGGSSKHRSSSSNYKDYFWLLCRLIQKFDNKATEEVINIRTVVLQVKDEDKRSVQM